MHSVFVNYDHENNDHTNTLIVILNGVIFLQILYVLMFQYALHILPVRFFPKCYFSKLTLSAMAKFTMNQPTNNVELRD